MNETKLYLVQRRAVYSQGECGIFDSLQLARSAVVHFKSLEPDDHHAFNIIEFNLNDLVKITGRAVYGSPEYDYKLVE